MPDHNGTFALSVNGNFADAAGDITLGGLDSLWTANGSDIYYDLGNVGIGITTPQGSIDVVNGNRRLLMDDANNRFQVYGSGQDDQMFFDFANHQLQFYCNDTSSYTQTANSFLFQGAADFTTHVNGGHILLQNITHNNYLELGSGGGTTLTSFGDDLVLSASTHGNSITLVDNGEMQINSADANPITITSAENVNIDANNGIILTSTSNIELNGATIDPSQNYVSTGDLSLMSGNAGIFNDGRVIGYDINTPITTLYTSGNGDFYIQDKINQNKTLDLDPDQATGFQLKNAADGNNYFTASSSIVQTRNTDGFSLSWNNANITANRTRQLVDAGGNEVLSVNGVASGSNGNVTIRNTLTKNIFTPTTGQTVNLVNGSYNVINPAGALLALTLNLPSSPADNDVVEIKSIQGVTTITYTGGTVAAPITTSVIGTYIKLVYSGGTWY
jgi:hypothetical protein